MIMAVASSCQRAEVFAFRYNVLACEQGVSDASINHIDRTVVDPADATGIVLGAWADGVLAGKVSLESITR